VWNSLLAFVAAWNKFTTLVSKTQTVVANAERDIKGYAASKFQARGAMADSAMLVRGAVQAYAKSINDLTLFDSVNFCRSKIMHGKSNTALSISQVIHDTGNANVANLCTYGVTPATITALGTLMTTYGGMISAPANSIAGRKMYNAEITTYLDQADDVLYNQIVKMMENFRVSAPDFYGQFFNDLRLIHGATHFTEIVATCKNNINQPIEGVTMVITNGVRTYSAISDFTGVADHKSMEPGDYTITFTKSGYQTHQINNVHIGLSEEETFSVTMVASPPPPVI